MTKDNTTDLLTATELARALGCSVAAVRAWQQKGIPHVRVSRLRRYRLPEVLHWLRLRENGRLLKRAEEADAKVPIEGRIIIRSARRSL
jgi:hypothetical protein